jgi:hypothetical protein
MVVGSELEGGDDARMPADETNSSNLLFELIDEYRAGFRAGIEFQQDRLEEKYAALNSC